MSRGAAAAWMAVLVLLAGCSGPVGPGDAETPTGTVTPAPLPEERATPHGPSALAPGLARGGVYDAGALAAAHADVLADVSFIRVREERRYLTDGTPRVSYRTAVWMSSDGERFRYRLDQTTVYDGRTTGGTVERYADGSVVYLATTRSGETTYSILTGQSGMPADPSSVFSKGATAQDGIGRLFAVLSFEVVDRRTVDGREVYRLSVTNESMDLPPLRNVTMNATVREDGLVSSYRLAYEVVRPERENIGVTVAVDFRGLGETRVRPPAWLPAAKRATTGSGTATPTAGPPTADGSGTTSGTENGTATTAGTRTAAVRPVSPLFPRTPGAPSAVSSPSWSVAVRP